MKLEKYHTFGLEKGVSGVFDNSLLIDLIAFLSLCLSANSLHAPLDFGLTFFG